MSGGEPWGFLTLGQGGGLDSPSNFLSHGEEKPSLVCPCLLVSESELSLLPLRGSPSWFLLSSDFLSSLTLDEHPCTGEAGRGGDPFRIGF